MFQKGKLIILPIINRKKNYKRKDPEEFIYKPAPKIKKKPIKINTTKTPEVKLTKKFQEMVNKNKENTEKRKQMLENIKIDEQKRIQKHKENVKNFRKFWKSENQKNVKKNNIENNKIEDEDQEGFFAEEAVEGDQCMAPLKTTNSNIPSNKILKMFDQNKGVFSKLRKNITKKVLDKPKLMESFGLKSRILNLLHSEIYS
jgi:hypothetical protein